MATDLYGDPNVNPRKPPVVPGSLTTTGTMPTGLHDQVNYSVGTGAPTGGGPNTPVGQGGLHERVDQTAEGTSLPPTQGAPTLPAGWEDAGNGMAKNASTGQMLPTNHPLFQDVLAGRPQGTGEAAPSAPTSPPPPPAAMSPEDRYMQALLSQMDEKKVPSVEDESIKAQLDPIRLENQRALDNEIRAGAEAGFAGGSSYGAPERVAAAQRAGERTGLAASNLVGQELQARRQEIQNALTQLGAKLSDDKRLALEEKLKTIDQAIQREGLAQTGALGNRDIDVRERLGLMGGNIDLMRLILGDKQANNALGAQIGYNQANLNNDALRILMNG